MLAPVTHILPLTTIRRERLLPVPGKVIVRKGQKVGATDTVAEANLAPEHLLVDVARGLGMQVEKADQQIKVTAGDQVSEGDVVAGPVGLTRRVVRSTRRGKVILAGGGQVLIDVQDNPFELKAGLPGVVSDLIPDRGAVIEATGTLIQGVWGNGGIDFGLMYVLAAAPDQLLTPDQLDVSLRGSIILAGHCEDAGVIKTAVELPLRGLILSSLEPDLIPLASKMRVPLLVVEGFGQRPMNSAAFKLLTSNERREVALNAEPWDRYAGTRPEIVIPLPATGELPVPKETVFFTPGQQVRVLSNPYAGKIGILVEIPGLTVFATGLRAPGAEVRFENGESAILPLANLDVFA